MASDKNRLDCADCERLIKGYLDDNLTQREMTGFLAHVKACPRCKEELSVQYLIEEGLSRLETGAAFDLNNEVEISLKRNTRESKLRYIRAVAVVALCALLIAVSFYYIIMLILNS